MDSRAISPISALNGSLVISQSQSDLQWFELIFFALTLPVLSINYLCHRRAPGGLLGWFFLWNYSAMRTVGYILLKVGGSKDLILAGTILTSASTSPLFFATAGIWHEVAHQYKASRPFVFGWCMQILIHLAVAGSIGFILAGAVTLYTTTGPQPSYCQPLILVGTVFFILIWVGLCVMLVFLWNISAKTVLEKRLLKGLAIALPFLGLRTLYGLCGAAINGSTWSYARGGPLAAQVSMQVIPDCLIILTYAVAGFITRNIAIERQNAVLHARPAYDHRSSSQGDRNIVQISEYVYQKA